MEARVPVKVGTRTASKLKTNHSDLTFLKPINKTAKAKIVDDSSKAAFAKTSPLVVSKIFEYLQNTWGKRTIPVVILSCPKTG